jgi:hypothetical protein
MKRKCGGQSFLRRRKHPKLIRAVVKTPRRVRKGDRKQL